ncbi:MAG: TlpA disulfide reductase family protein [Candidatus Bipolaricaulaceae bacterium]
MAAVLAALGLGLGLRPWATPPSGVEVGQTAPDFALPELSGQEVRLSAFRGKTVLLYFWQSTCPDCRKALPELLALRAQFPKEKLVLLTVNLDYHEEDMRRYLATLGEVDFLVLRGSYEAAMRVVDLFQVPYVPHVLLLDRRGVIRFRGTYPDFPTAEEVRRWL